MSTYRLLLAGLAVASLGLTATSARADFVLDLTQPGSAASSQGAWFYQVDPQPTGTGVIDPFVRIQRTGTEAGYNTDGQIEFDTKEFGGHNWTHSLLLSDLSTTNINGVDYYRFGLDVNEQGNDKGRYLSMNDFQIYLGDSPSLTGFTDGVGFVGHSQKVYDLDADTRGDGTVELDYKLNSGSGSGDMFVYVPASYFQGFGSAYKYVYLYSAFGQPNGSDAGFEEWWALKGPAAAPPDNPVVPAPPAVVLGGLALGLAGLFRRRFLGSSAA